MHLNRIYNLKHFKTKKDEEIIHQKIIKIAEDARRLGAVIQLKKHFREWLELEKAKLENPNPFIESKISNG